MSPDDKNKKASAKSKAAKPVSTKTSTPKAAAKPKVPAKPKDSAKPKASAQKAPAKADSARKPAEKPSVPGSKPPTQKPDHPKRAAQPRGRKPGKARTGLPWGAYIRLTRLNKPIGALLLLWPTLWALWLAAEGVPNWDLLVIFILGTFVMRSAGCVINDFADRKIDGHVARTRDRPLATGEVSAREALTLFVVLCLLAFGLVLLTNSLTIRLSFGGLALAFCYPFMKRFTQLPQVVLGAAFAWGIPMAFAAQKGELNQTIWLVYLAVVLWTVVYDTFYAMVDRDDDLRIGVKSTAILFGEQDRAITGFLQLLTIVALILVGRRFELTFPYYIGLGFASALFAYQQWLIRYRERNACFKAFMNNNWVGLVIFIGVIASYW
mgnify:CR=1 FL=1|jgi:4-hydroxybenzoate polyprenyltransferase